MLERFSSGRSLSLTEHPFPYVSDQGDGIPTAVLPQMFEPFFSTKAGAGTGLGLATVQAIVTEAGGAIEVKSAVGASSRFRCWFPAA